MLGKGSILISKDLLWLNVVANDRCLLLKDQDISDHSEHHQSDI